MPLRRQLWSDTEPAEILAWTGTDDYHLFGGFVEAWTTEKGCDHVVLASPLAKEGVPVLRKQRRREVGHVLEKQR